MRTIKVFPDYGSSGLWENHVNLDESEFEGVLSHTDLMALKYWHYAWEWNNNDGTPGNDRDKVPFRFWAQWGIDGMDMVDAWNMKQSEFKFVYQSA